MGDKMDLLKRLEAEIKELERARLDSFKAEVVKSSLKKLDHILTSILTGIISYGKLVGINEKLEKLLEKNDIPFEQLLRVKRENLALLTENVNLKGKSKEEGCCDFVNPNYNDKFSKLRGLDLQELIRQVDDFSLTYRNSLNLPARVTFGVEIEYEKLAKNIVDKFIDDNYSMKGFISDKDLTLNSGGEVISPVLVDKIDDWKDLQAICKFLRMGKATADERAGGHIHIGVTVLDDVSKWQQFVKIYTAYESVIFRFVYGDKLKARRTMKNYAASFGDVLYELIPMLDKAKTIDEFKDILPLHDGKRQAINFLNTNTIEFRCPNGTLDEIIWQNNVNTLTKMMLAPTKNLIDVEYLDYKLALAHEHISFKTFDDSNIVDLKNSLEFVDFIFDNNLDKTYFLKQYLKDFNDIYNKEKYVKVKKL